MYIHKQHFIIQLLLSPSRSPFSRFSPFLSAQLLLPPLTNIRQPRYVDLSVSIIPSLEKSIIERDGLYPLHVEVLEEIRVQVEEDGHVDRLVCLEPLLLEAEALNLAEVGRHLRGCDAVRGDADNVLVGPVGRRVEGQGRLPGEHADLALLGGELPRQEVRHRRRKRHADPLCVRHRLELQGRVRVGRDKRTPAVSADWLSAPSCCLANLFWGEKREKKEEGKKLVYKKKKKRIKKKSGRTKKR